MSVCSPALVIHSLEDKACKWADGRELSQASQVHNISQTFSVTRVANLSARQHPLATSSLSHRSAGEKGGRLALAWGMAYGCPTLWKLIQGDGRNGGSQRNIMIFSGPSQDTSNNVRQVMRGLLRRALSSSSPDVNIHKTRVRRSHTGVPPGFSLRLLLLLLFFFLIVLPPPTAL